MFNIFRRKNGKHNVKVLHFFHRKNGKGSGKQPPSKVNHQPQFSPSHRPGRATTAQDHLHSDIHSPQTNKGRNRNDSGTQYGRKDQAVQAFKPYKLERFDDAEDWLPPSVDECRHMLANTFACVSDTDEEYHQGKVLMTSILSDKDYSPYLSRRSSSSYKQVKMYITNGPRSGIRSKPNDSGICMQSSHATYEAKAPPTPKRSCFQRKPVPSTQPRNATFRAPRLPTRNNIPGLPNRLRDPRCLICNKNIQRDQEICVECEDICIAQYSIKHNDLVPQPLQTSRSKIQASLGHKDRIAGGPSTSISASIRKPLPPPKIELPQFSSVMFGREVFEATQRKSKLTRNLCEDDWAEYYFDGQRDVKKKS